MITLNITVEDYENFRDRAESAIEELEVLSRDVDWFVTNLPDLLRDSLNIIELARLQDAKHAQV